MELHAFDRQVPVAQAHDRAVGRLGGDLEHVGQARRGRRRASGSGWPRAGSGRPANTPAPSWLDRATSCRASARAPRPMPAAEDVADGLVAEADAEHRHARAGGGRDQRRTRCRRPPGGPGPGESRTASGSRASASSTVERVVAVDDRLGAELTEVLDEVVDEAVVVVDDEHPGGHGAEPAGPDRRLSNAFARRANLLDARGTPRSARPAAGSPRRAPKPGDRPSGVPTAGDADRRQGPGVRQSALTALVALHAAHPQVRRRSSPPWVPVLMFAPAHRSAALLIMLNYLELLPGAPSNWYLLGGLGAHPRRHHHRHAVPLTPGHAAGRRPAVTRRRVTAM